MKFQGAYFFLLRLIARLASIARLVSVFLASRGSSLKSTFEGLCGVGSYSTSRLTYFTADGSQSKSRLTYFTTDGSQSKSRFPYFILVLSNLKFGSAITKMLDAHLNLCIAIITSARNYSHVWHEGLYLYTIYSNNKININNSKCKKN